MKEAWFFWPLGSIFRAIGGIAVPKARGSQLSDIIIGQFKTSPRMHLAITPEGTRSRVTKWRTGFLHIAYETQVPIVLGAIDASQRQILIKEEFKPSGNIDDDMRSIKNYYRQFKGIRPEKFSCDDQTAEAI